MIANFSWSAKHTVIWIILYLAFTPFFVLSQEEGFAPSVEVNLLRDNNIFRTTEKVSDTFTSIAPTFVYHQLYGKQAVKAEYKGKYVFYADNSELNFLDHDFLVKALLDHSYKLSSEFTARYQDKIEQPGITNAITTQLSEFNQSSTTTLNAKIFYGTKQSAGQIVLDYSLDKLSFDNNQQEFRDRDDDKITGAFFYRIAPKTRILLEVSAADIDYRNNQLFDLSNDQQSYLAGVEWNATAITRSVFKVGYQDVNYTNELIGDISGLSYFLDMFWKPNSYSLIKIGASRIVRESAEQSVGGLLSNEFNVDIGHELTRRTKLSANYEYTEFDFDNRQDRQDELHDISVKLTYQAKHWLEVHLGVNKLKRKSTLRVFEFDANTINVGAVMSFN